MILLSERINEINNNFIKMQYNYNIFEYVKSINQLNENIVDISFIDDLLTYMLTDQCCIPTNLLVKYNILKFDYFLHISALLKQNGMIEEEDYIRMNDIFLLHSDTFKYCLIRSNNNINYSKQYMLLERYIKYYYHYISAIIKD